MPDEFLDPSHSGSIPKAGLYPVQYPAAFAQALSLALNDGIGQFLESTFRLTGRTQAGHRVTESIRFVQFAEQIDDAFRGIQSSPEIVMLAETAVEETEENP